MNPWHWTEPSLIFHIIPRYPKTLESEHLVGQHQSVDLWHDKHIYEWNESPPMSKNNICMGKEEENKVFFVCLFVYLCVLVCLPLWWRVQVLCQCYRCLPRRLLLSEMFSWWEVEDLKQNEQKREQAEVQSGGEIEMERVERRWRPSSLPVLKPFFIFAVEGFRVFFLSLWMLWWCGTLAYVCMYVCSMYIMHSKLVFSQYICNLSIWLIS